MRRSNPRLQGLIGVAAAIDWFTRAGYLVSIPLNDSQPYDLVVDDGMRLLRFQVKTTTARGRYGNFTLALQTAGGNHHPVSGDYRPHDDQPLQQVRHLPATPMTGPR